MGTTAKKIIPIGIIVILWLLFSFPYWGKGLIPFPSKYLVTFFPPWNASYAMPVKNNAMPDVITQIYPWKRVTVASWKAGQVPLWNPYSFSGTAHAGNYQSAVFSPVNVLFLLLPEIHAWSLMILLQPLLAGICMYMFLKSIHLPAEANVLGSIAFMFCGFIVVWMAYGTLGYAALYLPLALCAVNRHRGPLLAISIGLSFLSGHFQISLYVLLFSVIYIMFRRWLAALWYVGLGLLFAAPQLLPAFDAYSVSVRSGLFTKGEIIPWQYLITLFSPDFYGNPVTRNDWFGHYAEWAGFVGVVPLVLVGAAWVLNKKNSAVLFFSMTSVIPLLFALPTPLTNLLYAAHIPVLSTSAASRIIVLSSFSLAVLSAIGFDSLIASWNRDSWKRLIGLGISVSMFIIIVWAVMMFIKPLPPEKLSVAIHNTILPTALLLLTSVVIVLGYILPKKLKCILPYILILLAAFDIYRFAAKWMPFDPPEYMYPHVNVITFVQNEIAENRARVQGGIGGEVAVGFGIPVLEGYDAVYQARYGKLISFASTGEFTELNRSVVEIGKHGKYTEDLLKLLGVRYLVHRVSDGRNVWAYPFWKYPSYRSIWKDDTYEVFEDINAFPRVFLASSYTLAATDDEIMAALFTKELNVRDTLVLESDPLIRPATGSGAVTITSYEPNRMTARVVSDVPKLMFLSDVYDSGWHASVDGLETPIYRADYDFRAVAVPGGTHEIVMWYWPKSMTLGLLGAGFATLWCIRVGMNRKHV